METNFILTEKEQLAATETAKKLVLQQPLRFAAAAQKDFCVFSETVLRAAKFIELGELEALIGQLNDALKGFTARETKKCFLQKLISRPENMQQAHHMECEIITERLEPVSALLERHQLMLRKNTEIIEQMNEKNLEYYKMLTLYIQAGKMRLDRERETTLANMREIARRTELPLDLQTVKNFEDVCRGFAQRLRNLDATRNTSIQLGHEIRAMQSSNAILSDKLQEVLLSAIPLWKNSDRKNTVIDVIRNALDDVLQTHENCRKMRQETARKIEQILLEEHKNV